MKFWNLAGQVVKGPLLFDDINESLVIEGPFVCDSQINIRVNNLIVLGDCFTTQDAKLEVANTLFLLGRIRANKVSSTAQVVHFELNPIVKEKINALGLHMASK